MKATDLLQNLGHSIWLDHVAGALDPDTLERLTFESSVTGFTANPPLPRCDLVRAADLLRPVHDRTDAFDGWVSSPTIRPAERPNILLEMPGTAETLAAVEEAVFEGVHVHVTLLFSREQYLSAAEAYLRGIERRLDACLDPRVSSVASVPVGNWDTAADPLVPRQLRNRLGIAVAKRIYRSARALLAAPRWRKLQQAGARPQRLLWAAPDVRYAEALAAPNTVISLPETAIHALSRRQAIGSILPADGGDCEEALARFASCGIDLNALALRLQQECAGPSESAGREFVPAAVR
jgi:transaldolase